MNPDLRFDHLCRAASDSEQVILDRRKDWIVQAASLMAVAAGVYYVTWRLLATLNRDALWFAVPLWAAEAYGLLTSVMFFFMVWHPSGARCRPTVPTGLSVDIFIPTYKEPVWMVRRTVLGALAVRYPHKTYLLDDGNRPEVARLAQELGCRYLARAENLHAKAGNLNNALRLSSGAFIAIFDADHAPLPEFLDRTLGYFADARVAFVQTPEDFYNVDSYVHRVDVETRRIWHEQALFFRVIQPGKDRWNAAFFSGSCAVIRRQALEDVGGFATETVTEDIHTSIRLHARGWRSVYHDEALAYGLAPPTALPYHIQRLRWGQGAMQVLRYDNPLVIRGLTLAQRISYLASLTHVFDGYQTLIFYLAPPISLLTGILPVRSLGWDFLAQWAVYYLTMLLAYKMVCRGYGMMLLSEFYNRARFYTYIKSTAGLVRRRLRFLVTPKEGATHIPLRVVMPQLLLAIVIGTGVLGGTFRIAEGRDSRTLAYTVNMLWALWNLSLFIWVVWVTRRKVERRKLHRVPATIPVQYATEEGREGTGVLLDIHGEGAGIRIPEACLDATSMRLRLLWFDGLVTADARVVSQRGTPAGLHVGLQFLMLSPKIRYFLDTFIIPFAQRKFMNDIGHPMDWLGAQQWHVNRRRSRRWRHHLPVRIQREAQETWGVTEAVSIRGALLLAPLPIPDGVNVRMAPWGNHRIYDARVVRLVTLTKLAPYSIHRIGVCTSEREPTLMQEELIPRVPRLIV